MSEKIEEEISSRIQADISEFDRLFNELSPKNKVKINIFMKKIFNLINESDEWDINDIEELIIKDKLEYTYMKEFRKRRQELEIKMLKRKINRLKKYNF